MGPIPHPKVVNLCGPNADNLQCTKWAATLGIGSWCSIVQLEQQLEANLWLFILNYEVHQSGHILGVARIKVDSTKQIVI